MSQEVISVMQPKYAILHQPDQEEISTSQEFAHLLETFLAPLLTRARSGAG